MAFVKPKIYMADFETTVTGENNKQESTEVWASAFVQIQTPDGEVIDDTVYIDNSIDSFFARVFFTTGKGHSIVYFHNLKFDGSFIVDWLLKKDYSLALNEWDNKWAETKYMPKGSFKCTISNMGQWYSIEIKSRSGAKVTIKDSLKLLPFSVDTIGKSFGTLHKKLSMEYVGDMHAGGTITEEQKKYITNDVLVVKEALEIFFADGLDKLTIGSCCKDQYKKTVMECDQTAWFPQMTKIKLESSYGSQNAEQYIRHAYKGGWCYLRPDRANQIFYDGCTADVNSLYPSMMLDNDYPVGKPTFWKGSEIPEIATKPNHTYIIRVKTRFYLKEGFLPTIQIKNSPYYESTEWLTTSDVIYNGTSYRTLVASDGSDIDLIPTLTLTEMDWKLLNKHYNLEDTEILDGCYFDTLSGYLLFGMYINKWAEVKKTSEGARRQEAKLFLNNLYGKFSAKIDNTTKAPYLEDGKVKFYLIEDEDPDKEWYIPIGAFITSYARRFTITAAQENYDRFIYADTDSIHCTGDGFSLKGIKIDPVNFSCWDIEAEWDQAIFVRQKTYIEHVVRVMKKDCKMHDVEPFYNIKCAGMDKRPKKLLEASISGTPIETNNREEELFLATPRSLQDFKVGLSVPGKLMTKRIPGGILLVSSDFHLR